MNKIEEILRENENYNCVTEEFLPEVINAMREFGKLCFDAATEVDTSGGYFGGPKYEDFEDFLKEIENVKIN